MITRVSLKNWKSHLDSEFKFSEGTNCLIGIMGSGKTSVWDAICFALFGTFPQLNQKKLKLEDVIMKKPRKMNQSEVTVFFDIGDNEWSVKRIITKGKTSAELRKDGELIEGPQTSKVTEEIKRLLKIDYDLFTRAIYSEQNQLDMFLNIAKGERMKKIDQLLALDKFEKARANTRTLINKCSVVIREKRKIIQTMEADESLKKIELIKREISNLLIKDKELKNQINQVKIRKSNIIKDRSKLKEQQEKLQKIENDIQKFTSLLELTEKDIEKLKEDLVEVAEKTTEELKNDIERISEEIEKINLSLKSERENLDELKNYYAEEQAKIDILKKEKIPEMKKISKERDKVAQQLRRYPLKKLKSQLKVKNNYLKKQERRLQGTITRLSDLQESLRELRAAGSTCPVCSSKLTSKKKSELLSKKRRLIIDLKKDKNKIEPDIKKTETFIKRLETRIKNIEKLEERFKELKDSKLQLKLLIKELKELKSKTRTYDSKRRMYEKNINILQKNSEELSKQQEKFKLMLTKKEDADIKLKRAKEYTIKISHLRKEKESLVTTFSESTLERLESEFQSILGLERELETRLDNLSVVANEKRKLLEEIENKMKTIENYKIEIRKIEGISNQLRLLENALLNTQEQLRKDFVIAVNQAMQSIWNDMYPYKDIYSIRLAIEGRDYVLQLLDSTGWVTADGTASGGERTMACLALRIAFSLVLAPQLKWLVLDEPTHNLDSKAVEDLAKVLREKINEFVEQVFLITHDTSLEAAVSGYLYRLERDKERDGYTKVNFISTPL